MIAPAAAKVREKIIDINERISFSLVLGLLMLRPWLFGWPARVKSSVEHLCFAALEIAEPARNRHSPRLIAQISTLHFRLRDNGRPGPCIGPGFFTLAFGRPLA
jgi:hypothetical protein